MTIWKYLTCCLVGIYFALTTEPFQSIICADLNLAKSETATLLALLAELQVCAIALPMDKIMEVDCSGLADRLGIYEIIIRNGFTYEDAKLLYQYHSYHDLVVGSTNALVEFECPVDVDPIENPSHIIISFSESPFVAHVDFEGTVLETVVFDQHQSLQSVPPKGRMSTTEKTLLLLYILNVWVIVTFL